MKKIKLWDSEDFVYMLSMDSIYMSSDKKTIYFTRLPTDRETDGFYEYTESDSLELEVGDNESNLYIITETMSKDKFVKFFEGIIKEIKNNGNTKNR